MKQVTELLEELKWARMMADHAEMLGMTRQEVSPRVTCRHLGAVLADAALQAGVSYSVVRTRVERIELQFPEAATLPGLLSLVREVGPSDFLQWRHHVKTTRFTSLVQLVALLEISSTFDLTTWLLHNESKDHLTSLHGVGPKTYDYLCCLVGIDSIAVDRHLKSFALEAGVEVREYERLKSVAMKAADLLNIGRRDFDSWIWRTVSERRRQEVQPQLEFDSPIELALIKAAMPEM